MTIEKVYDELNARIDKLKTSSGGGGGTSSNYAVYQTDEIEIGKWVDDKPIYRKIITGTLANGDQDITVTDLDKLISVYGGAHMESATGVYFPVNSGHSSYYCDVKTRGNPRKLYVTTSGQVRYGARIIIEYTKTTD